MAWVFLPDQRTALACVLDEAGLTSASCSPSPAITLEHSSNGKSIPGLQSSQRSAQDISRQRPSGTISSHSTDASCEAASTPSSPDTPASRLAKQGSAKAMPTSGTSGQTLLGSSERCSRDGSSSKTSPGTSPSALKPFCATYEEWASLLRLAHSQRLKLVRRMKGSASSSWPTATAKDENRDSRGPNAHEGMNLAEKVNQWPTPMAGTPAQNGNSAAGNSDFSRGVMALWQTPVSDDAPDREKGKINSRGEPKLSGQALLWGTPKGSDGEKGGPNMSYSAGGIPLPAQAAQWPTPAARDHKGENSPAHLTNGTGRLHLDQLPNAVAHLFSRPAPAIMGHGLILSPHAPISRPLWAWMTASHGRSVSRRLWKGRTKRRLNPLFVEWLMGWPQGHALCACSAMEFTLWQQHMRGALLQLPMASGPWIWEPTPQEPKAEQMTMFGGL